MMAPKKNNLIFGMIIGLIGVIIIGFYLKPDAIETPPALIGGPFELINNKGIQTTPDDFSGKIMVIYFGYSFCPDVCPTDMQKISIALDILEKKQIDTQFIQPLFITIDPDRDTPEIIDEFISNFHPSFIGLTGSTEQIKKAASAYRVYYQKAGNTEDKFYLMDHSSLIYVMGPDGHYLSHFSSLDSPQVIAERLEKYIEDIF